MIQESDLLEYGFKKNTDSDQALFPYEKILAEEGDGILGLVVTTIMGQFDIAICTPTGELIFISAINSLEELKPIEKSITGWMAN